MVELNGLPNPDLIHQCKNLSLLVGPYTFYLLLFFDWTVVYRDWIRLSQSSSSTITSSGALTKVRATYTLIYCSGNNGCAHASNTYYAQTCQELSWYLHKMRVSSRVDVISKIKTSTFMQVETRYRTCAKRQRNCT